MPVSLEAAFTPARSLGRPYHAQCQSQPSTSACRPRHKQLASAGRQLRTHAVCQQRPGSDNKEEPSSSDWQWPSLPPALTGCGLAAASILPAALPLAGGSGGSGRGFWWQGGGGDGGGDPGRGDSSADAGNNPLFDLAAADEDDEVEDEELGEDEEYEEEEEEEEAEDAAEVAAQEPADEDPAAADGDDDDEGGGMKDGQFFCAEVKASGLATGPGCPTEEELFAGLHCQPGFPCSRQDLSEDLRALLGTGLFENVDAKVHHLGKGKSRVEFLFREMLWRPLTSFRVTPAKPDQGGASAGGRRDRGGRNELLIPQSEVDRVVAEVGNQEGLMGLKQLARIKDIIEGWYAKRGYVFGYISHFDGLDTGSVTAHIVEGKVNKVHVVPVDENGNPREGGGELDESVIMREVPFKKGQLYNTEDGRKALRDIFALQLFDNVQIYPRQDQVDQTKVGVDVMVKERPMRTADLELEWQIAPGERGRPGLVSLVPGGTLTAENRNLDRVGRLLTGQVNCQNFLAPADDIAYRFEYKRPYVWGGRDPNKTALAFSAFNARRVSSVFTPGPGGEEVPAIFVDRAGAKVALQQQYSRNSKGSLGLVIQRITARDESGAVTAHGTKQLPNGMLAADGPPATLSSQGRDIVPFVQAHLVRDRTHYSNGALVGARDIFHVDQGLLLGTGWPFFNRHTISLTRFLQLKAPAPGSTRSPPVLVLHGRYGGSIGDMASYDYFILGGPYSVRGYNVGELAACRRFVEGALELRVPVWRANVFAFMDAGSDLGSSKECAGNPTQYFRRAGSGSSKGVGIKLGALRIEYATDDNAGRGSLFLRYGDRF